MCEDGLPVRKIRARPTRRGGNVAVTFEVAPETWRRFVREAERTGHPDTIDYLAGVLNAALIEQEPLDMGDPGREFPVPDAEEPGDLDDGIPF